MADSPPIDRLGVDPRSLKAAGWTQADLDWESLSVRALLALEKGAYDDAKADFTEAFALAGENFQEGDPRLGTAIANYALGEPEEKALLGEALTLWKLGASWLESLKGDRRARSATYHLRLEKKFEGNYDRWWQQRHLALYEEGLARIEARAAGQGFESGFALWKKEKPNGLVDLRKIMAAARLIA